MGSGNGTSKAGRPKNPPNQRRALAADREATAVRLSLAGANLEQIRQQTGYSDTSGVVKALRRGIDKLYPHEESERLRAVVHARYEALLSGLWGAATAEKRMPDGSVPGPQLDAIDRVLKILADERRLLGLDAPVQVAGSLTLNLTEAEAATDRELREEWERWATATAAQPIHAERLALGAARHEAPEDEGNPADQPSPPLSP